MALSAGRVGVNEDQVDDFGKLTKNDVSFEDLTEFKLKLDESLLYASDFDSFKNSMLN